MTQARISLRCATATLSLALLLAVGCRVEKTSSGDGENVKVATPFGGLSVKTDDKAVEAETGLPQYPGATVVKKNSGDDDHDTGAADVNMSFAGFQLRVKAVSYHTADSSDKVMAFYRKGLARFGTVIECANDKPVGTPTSTPDGLTCSDENNQKVHINDKSLQQGGIELKAGSEKHQHIVSIEPQGVGTKFGLIALDLPGKFPFGLDSDSDSDKSKDKGNQPE